MPDAYDYLTQPAGMGPAHPLLVPLQAGLAAYHQPTYRQPTAEEQAMIMENLRALQEQRSVAAKNYGDVVNAAVKGRQEYLAAALEALVGYLEAESRNNMASAEQQGHAMKLYSMWSDPSLKAATAVLFELPSGDPAAFNQMVAENSNAAVVEAQKAGLSGLNPEAQEQRARALLEPRVLGMEQAGTNYLGTTVSPQSGDLRVVLDGTTSNLIAAVQQMRASGLDSGVADRLIEDYTNRLTTNLSSTPVAQGIRAGASDQLTLAQNTLAGHLQTTKEYSDKYGEDPKVRETLLNLTGQIAGLADITDPSVYGTMVRSASDVAAAPVAKLLADLSEQEGALQRSLEVQDDPFFAQLRVFAEKHPWYETWMRSQGFRHHQEAVRWLLANKDTVGVMDNTWQQIQQEQESPELAEGNPLGAGDMITPRELSQRLRNMTTPEGKAGTLAGVGMNTNKIGRALSEIGGLFRRDPGAARAAIPAAPGGSGLSQQMGRLGNSQGGAQFGARPLWKGAGAYAGDPRNQGTGGTVTDPPPPTGQPPAPAPAGGAPSGAPATPGTPVAAWQPRHADAFNQGSVEDPQARRARMQAELDPYKALASLVDTLRVG